MMKSSQIMRILLGFSLVIFVFLGTMNSHSDVYAGHASDEEVEGYIMFSENIRGYNVEIRGVERLDSISESITLSDASEIEVSDIDEILLVDGEVVPYLRTSEGYRIYYQPPESDLISAARSYMATQPVKSE